MLERIDHIDLRVPSLAGAEVFLTSLGLEVVRRHDAERGSIEMALPGERQVVFEVREDPAATTTTVDHIAFRTDASTADQLAAGGIDFTRLHHSVAATGRTVSNLVDPFGGKWQLAEETS